MVKCACVSVCLDRAVMNVFLSVWIGECLIKPPLVISFCKIKFEKWPTLVVAP